MTRLTDGSSLVGHTALVTGASRGLGAAIASELGCRGASVIINAFANIERAEALAEQIRGFGSKALAVKADVRDEASIAAMFAEIAASRLGPVDLCVFNATGPQPMMSIEEQRWEDFQQQMDFFVKSPMLIVKHLLPSMKERRYGRLLHIGSEVFELGVPRFAHYVAAKGAQLGLARSWARELAPWGITCNLIAPGWIPTERHADAGEEEMKAYAAQVPLGHMGEPEDIAATAAFLLSGGARFITGQRISVNGGNTIA